MSLVCLLPRSAEMRECRIIVTVFNIRWGVLVEGLPCVDIEVMRYWTGVEILLCGCMPRYICETTYGWNTPTSFNLMLRRFLTYSRWASSLDECDWIIYLLIELSQCSAACIFLTRYQSKLFEYFGGNGSCSFGFEGHEKCRGQCVNWTLFVQFDNCGVDQNLCLLDVFRFLQSKVLVIRNVLVKKSSDLKKYWGSGEL